MCRPGSKCCSILKWYTKVREYLPSQVTNFWRIKRSSRHCPSRALRGTPFFQFTFMSLSTTKRYQRFLSSFWFLKYCTPVFYKPVTTAIDFSVTLNLRGPIFTWPFLKLCANCRATSLLCSLNFCRNGRKPESHNNSRLLWNSVVWSTSLRDDGSQRTGSIAANSYELSNKSYMQNQKIELFINRDPTISHPFYLITNSFHQNSRRCAAYLNRARLVLTAAVLTARWGNDMSERTLRLWGNED